MPAIFAGIALVLAGALSVGGVTVFGTRAGFGFLPLLVIAIWPRNANALLSVLFLFVAGVFTDWATGGIVGQWALVYTGVWAAFRPELRSSPYMLMSVLVFWLLICILASVLLSVSGWFVFGIFPDLGTFVRQALTASACLPFILLLRGVFSRLLGDGDEWGR